MRIERPARRRNSIVLTSLVDVMFVLLFFFMLASSYLDWGTLDVHIGGKAAASPGALPPAHVLLLRPDGQWRLDGQPLDPARLEAALPSASRVVVQPASGVSLQELVAVVDRLKAAGVALTLGAAPP